MPFEDLTGMMSLGSTSSSLLTRVKQQDPAAWRRLVQLYGPAVFLWCRRAGLNSHDAADVVQETFTAVSVSIHQFRRERPEDSFRGWLWTVTRNKVRDHLRRARGQVHAQGGTSAQAELVQVPERPSDEAEGTPLGTWLEQRALDTIRAEFEDRTWAAFWQATVDGLTAAEIAADLGMSQEAVRQAKYRVLRRLRVELDGLLDD